MTESSRDAVLGLLHAARRRIRANAALHVTAIALWPLAGATWLEWLVHQFLRPVTVGQVGGVVATWALLTGIALAARLPGNRQTLVHADRALGAQSLFVCALDHAPPGRRVSAAAADRVNRDARALASRLGSDLGGDLRGALPITWPSHGTVALLALAAAAALLSLPGARADTRWAIAVQPMAPTATTARNASTFGDSARALTLALAAETRRDRPTQRGADKRPSTRPSTHPSTSSATAQGDPVAARESANPARATATARHVDAPGGGGEAASDTTTGRVSERGRADETTPLTRQTIERRESSQTPAAERYLPLDALAHSAEHANAIDLASVAATSNRQRYRSPAMRHYLARFEQTRQETDR